MENIFRQGFQARIKLGGHFVVSRPTDGEIVYREIDETGKMIQFTVTIVNGPFVAGMSAGTIDRLVQAKAQGNWYLCANCGGLAQKIKGHRCDGLRLITHTPDGIQLPF